MYVIFKSPKKLHYVFFFELDTCVRPNNSNTFFFGLPIFTLSLSQKDIFFKVKEKVQKS